MKSAVLLLLIAVIIAALPPIALGSAEIVIDNPAAALSGSWQTGTSSSDKYGNDYRFAGQNTTTAKSATYTPDIPVSADDWEVYTWYPQGTGRPIDAEYTIHTAAGDLTKYVNQQVSGGRWVYLGTYSMNAGTGNYVRITNYGADTTKVVVADAIRFFSLSAGSGQTVPPVISAVSATPSESGVTVAWTTDKPATSQSEYGLTTSYGSETAKDASLALTHSLSMTGLTPQTLYHYRVKSEDTFGNPAVSGDYTFTTPASVPAVLSNIATAPGESTTAVTWNTNKPATSQVEYGLTTSYGSQTAYDPSLDINHAVNLSGLTPQTGYHCRVRSVDAFGNVTISEDHAFTTTASTPPVLSQIAVIPMDTSASVTWMTDESATTQVEYGLTTSYGSSTTMDSTPALSHTAGIVELASNTQYHYRVKSQDAVGNLSTSQDLTFTTTAPLESEFRAVWVDTWHNGIFSASQITNLVNTCKQSNYNVIIPEVRKAGDAYYNSAYEPRATNIPGSATFDPLGDLITKAHAAGIQVHPWIVVYRIWNSNWGDAPANHVWTLHPEWAMTDTSGVNVESGYYNLDPGVPGVQDYICKIVMDILTKYDADGINWDYVRYPGSNWGYNSITRQRFHDEYGYYPPISISDANWEVWSDYRRRQVTDLVKKCYLNVMAAKPRVSFSVDSVGWMHGDPNADYTDTRQYDEVFQNSKSWMEQHIVDANMLMNYKREHDSAQAADYDLWTNWLACMQASTGRHGVDGQGNYMNSIGGSVHQMQVARGAGIGITNYNYATTNKDSQPAADFWSAVKTNVFPTSVPVPEMPWKTSPTTGIIFGTVTDASKPNDPVYQDWIYKATVTVTGPETRTTETDGTGTYGFLDLTPGKYTITVTKSGFATRTYTEQSIEAGDVIREDFNLGYITATSPTGAVGAGWNTFSLPYEPVNAAPASVLAGANINNRLFRWDNPTQSQERYVTGEPGFGNMTMGDGYVLTLSAPYTISYQAYGGSPAMRDISLPTTGFAIIGCPMDREVVWENVMVTKDAETVTLREAAKTRNWLSSVGFWWNSADQSQYDIGLPEDNCGSTSMLPWHAYELNTFTNGLTLTLK